MGLLDDASNLLNRRAEQESEARLAQEGEYVPRSAEWSLELAAFLTDQAVPPHPVYLAGPLTEPVLSYAEHPPGTPALMRRGGGLPVFSRTQSSSFWDEAWPVQGWSQGSDYGPQPVQLLLTPAGSVWWSMTTTFHSLELRDGKWVDNNPHGHTIAFPNVRPEHREKLVLVGSRPKNNRSFTYGFDPRNDIAVPVAAAVSAGRATGRGDWIVGVKP